VQSSEYLQIRNDVHLSVLNYYKYLNREAKYFLETKNEEWDWTYLHFLVDKKRVVRYGFGVDRNMLLGGVEIGIGPHYFGAADFWSYEKSTNFVSSVDTESIFHNLRLLDEYWQTSS
jgi:hypothetical protein